MKFLKQTAAVLAGSLLAGSCITPAAVSAKDAVPAGIREYGDVNADNSVDVADAVLTARYVAADPTATVTDMGRSCADVNLDGNVDGTDVTQILEYIAKKRDYLGYPKTSDPGYQSFSLTKDLTAQTVKDKAVDEAFVKSQYDLTAKLMKEISFSDTEHDNILLSPLSIASALAMTANGADGETRAEMEQLLGGTLSMEELNAYYLNYLANLPSSDNAKLHLANSIWNSEELQIRDDYLQTVKNYYGDMDVFKAPFTDSTMNEINSWISDKTDDKIQDMLKYMAPNAVTYLINALAFDAEWENAWKETADGVFTDYDGTKLDVTLMKGTEKYYISDKYAEGFIKPYAGSTYSFVGILPRESLSVTLSDYVGMMDADSLQKLLGSRTEEAVQVALPKFGFAYDAGDTLLGSALQKLGMKKAFSGEADFSKLYEKDSEGVYIGRVLHNTFIDVNETGTQAAAATIVEMTRKGGGAPSLSFSRPFLFMIIDERTQLPVFIGSVRNPGKTTE